MNARYKTLDTLSLFQHQANHYKNIINPKRTTIFPQDPQANTQNFITSALKNKHANQISRVLKLENRRMLKELMHLEKKKGLMQKAEENYRNFTSQSKRLSLVNPYKSKYSQTQRQNQNKTLELKCKGIEPNVGSKQEWARHQQFNKNIMKRLSNKSPFSKQVRNTQAFMEILQTTDKIGWTDLLIQNKQAQHLKSKQKSSSRRKSKSMANKKRRKLSNLQNQKSSNESLKVLNAN